MLFPGLASARDVALEVIQEPGETIFVPSDVFHTVENLEPTLSINHNWLNAHNLHRCCRHVQSELVAWQEARREATSCSANLSFSAVRDASQPTENLHLLWQVISQRVREILEEARQLEDAPQETRSRALSTLRLDCSAIAQVIDGFRSILLASSRHDNSLMGADQIDDLVRKLQAVVLN